MASILYQLAVNPHKQEIVHQEINRLLPDNTKLTSEKLEEMTYLKACIKETLRFYYYFFFSVSELILKLSLRMFPVVIGNGRQTTQDSVINGYHVPKGVQVIFQHYVISNQEEYFKRSTEFLPERWLKLDRTMPEHHSFASLPFGFGKRMCLGKRFAELELQILLTKVKSLVNICVIRFCNDYMNFRFYKTFKWSITTKGWITSFILCTHQMVHCD